MTSEAMQHRTARRIGTSPASRRPAGAVTRIVYTLGFLFFDREAGRVRPSAVTGLIVVVLAVVCHVWLSGPWLRQAGFADVPHSAPAAISTPPPASHAPCRGSAGQRERLVELLLRGSVDWPAGCGRPGPM